MANKLRIKFCGLTRQEDVAYAAALGIDAIGLIFSPQSPRCLSLKQAKLLVQKIPPFMDVVAVFVNPDAAQVDEVIKTLAIRTLQFHGTESAEFCDQFDRPYIKAMPVESSATFDEYNATYPQAAAFLLETPSTSYGGTGKTFDWGLIPASFAKPLILAGGLNATNIKAALKQCSPYAVDLCSGVEVSPGIKDHEKMRQFVCAIGGKL
jgi:phosphoribosylanthranilate isomerase